ncbi:MAG: tetratricopeptide repeat protein, partial [Spirulinaceae cyanobacterium]
MSAVKPKTRTHQQRKEVNLSTLAWVGIAAIAIQSVFSLGIFPQVAIAQDNLRDQLDVSPYNDTQGILRDEADTLVRVGGEAYRKGNLNKALDYWNQSLNIYSQIGDEEAMGSTYGYLGVTYGLLGRYNEAEDAFRRRLGLARDRANFQGQMYALNNLGIVLLYR